ncbi:MAG: hypothetical protein KAJ19_13620 [Gammaproteobacteria bacterium]|nr:hypothetical protein [Gammaproteobacteria bacterium]
MNWKDIKMRWVATWVLSFLLAFWLSGIFGCSTMQKIGNVALDYMTHRSCAHVVIQPQAERDCEHRCDQCARDRAD